MTGRPDVRAAGSAGGFTLVELLVTISLLGLITVALFGGLRFGARAWETGAARGERASEVEVAQGLLRRQLQQMLFQINQVGEPAFIGEERFLAFLAPSPSQFALGGVYGFALSLERAEKGFDLVLTWRLNRPDQSPLTDDDEAERRTLLEGVSGLEVRYFGARDSDRLSDWHDTWENVPQPPTLISLKVALPEGDERTWPQLTVAPRTVTGALAR